MLSVFHSTQPNVPLTSEQTDFLSWLTANAVLGWFRRLHFLSLGGYFKAPSEPDNTINDQVMCKALVSYLSSQVKAK